MILYGWNNYLLKSVQLQELGIMNAPDPGTRIEYRQKYFHLFFIPVFPLGKFWAVRQGGKLYEPAAQLHQALESVKVNTKNWIWSWTGILLVLGGYFIYNMNAKMEHYNYKKRTEANATVLNAYFKEEKNTAPLASKMHTLNYLVDSCINDEDYEKKKIDTAMNGLLKLYLNILATQKDSLTGYNKENTAVFTCINHQKDRSYLPDENIRKALNEGVWNGYSDTSGVFHSLQQLRDYKYLLVLKEYNRVSPTAQGKTFTPGISLANGIIINIDNKKIEHTFKVMATNSDSVSHYSYSSRGESSSPEWYSVLQGDLNGNAMRKGAQYVFHDESLRKRNH
jgi:hypothetical protein